MRMARRRRLDGRALLVARACVLGGLIAVGVLFVAAAPAGATINQNSLGCEGQAVITPKHGAPVTINATQSQAHVPRSAAAPVTYSGSVTTVTHNQHGYVAVTLGPFKIHFYSWSGANRSNKTSDSGTRKYPSELAVVPPGKYRVTGGHFSAEGSCTGEMTIIVDGSPLSTPAGIVAAGGTVVFAGLVLFAGVARAGSSRVFSR
jgi:hypothetical protein